MPAVSRPLLVPGMVLPALLSSYLGSGQVPNSFMTSSQFDHWEPYWWSRARSTQIFSMQVSNSQPCSLENYILQWLLIQRNHFLVTGPFADSLCQTSSRWGDKTAALSNVQQELCRSSPPPPSPFRRPPARSPTLPFLHCYIRRRRSLACRTGRIRERSKGICSKIHSHHVLSCRRCLHSALPVFWRSSCWRTAGTAAEWTKKWDDCQ